MTGCAIDILTHTLYHLDTYYYDQLFNSTVQHMHKIFCGLQNHLSVQYTGLSLHHCTNGNYQSPKFIPLKDFVYQ